MDSEKLADFIATIMGNRIKCELKGVGIYSLRPF
jgi:hypothetical protein